MSTVQQLISEFRDLSHEGGWIFWCLVILAFAISFALLSIWQSLYLSRRHGDENNEVREADLARTSRRIQFAFVLIGAAPLIGLLGTVSGMFATFNGLAAAASSAPVDVISRGISEALITTQTGLIIAIPTFIVCTFFKFKHSHTASSPDTEPVT